MSADTCARCGGTGVALSRTILANDGNGNYAPTPVVCDCKLPPLSDEAKEHLRRLGIKPWGGFGTKGAKS